jgi:hypothetical protein
MGCRGKKNTFCFDTGDVVRMTQIYELFVISTVLISAAEVICPVLFCHTVGADTHLGACGIGQGDCVK